MTQLTAIESGPNFTIYSDGKQKLIKIDKVRVSYPAFGAMKENEADDGTVRKNWGGRAMLPKGTHVAARTAFVKLLNELAMANEVKIPPEFRPIKDGDDVEGEEFAGHWLINFSDANRRPAIRDKNGTIMLAEADIDRMFYGGCWASLLLRPWYFGGRAKGSTKTFPKRICCGFIGAQFVKDDTPFGSGAIDDSNVWGAAEGGDDGLDDDDGDGL